MPSVEFFFLMTKVHKSTKSIKNLYNFVRKPTKINMIVFFVKFIITIKHISFESH